MYKYLAKIKGFLQSVFHVKTLGVRAILVKDNHVLLVKHTYLPQWYLPGGGIDQGETPLTAIKRELQEEVGISLKTEPKLFSVYYSNHEKRDDYIIIYSSEDFEQDKASSGEIDTYYWFDLTYLPENISPATRRRIEEFQGLRKRAEVW